MLTPRYIAAAVASNQTQYLQNRPALLARMLQQGCTCAGHGMGLTQQG